MTSGPSILTLDIETKPTRADVWDLWNQNVGLAQIHDPTRMMCFAYKWNHKRTVGFSSEFHNDRQSMVELGWSLLDEADFVVTYNGDNFDIPHLNREFLELGLTPPAPFTSIDLYKVNKKNFRFVSKKLAFITGQLELTGKLEHTGHQLWVDCMNGDAKAWNLMRRYNKQDVVTTEELFEVLRPWIAGLNYGLYVDDSAPVCPKCGKNNLEKRGFSRTKVSKYQRYQCQDCGGWSRGGKRVEGVDVR